MSLKRLRMVMVLIMFAAAVFIPMAGLAADSVNIEGEVGDNYQIVANDGQVYEIADTTQGNDLAEHYLGEKVKVTGTVEKDGDVQVITVMSFEAVAK